MLLFLFAEEPCTKVSGIVKWFNPVKGYGFIKRENDEDVFVHYSAIQSAGFKTLDEDDKVEFCVTQGEKGPKASEVKRLTDV